MEYVEVLKEATKLVSKKMNKEAREKLEKIFSDSEQIPIEIRANALYLEGISFFQDRNPVSALASLEKSVKLYNSLDLPVQKILAITALARVTLLCGDRQKSLESAREAESILLKCHDIQGAQRASSLFSLSINEYATGNLQAAEKLLLEALSIWKAVAGDDSLECSTCLNNLGRICEETDRTEEGIAFHRQALAIRKAKLGVHHETAFSYGNLGTALASAGHWSEAADMLKTAIEYYGKCGHTGGHDITGYKNNLELCKKMIEEEYE